MLAVIAAAACSSERSSRVDTSSQHATLPTTAAPDWPTFEAGAFTIQYPRNAKLIEARSHPSDLPGTGILGPQIHLPVAPDVGPSDGAAYQLVISSFPNPGKFSTQQWVESIRRRANSAPMDADSLTFLRAPDTVAVGAYQFLRLRPFCGDCGSEELYLAHGDRTAVLSYIFDISLPGDRDQQRKTYLAMLKTLRWKQ